MGRAKEEAVLFHVLVWEKATKRLLSLFERHASYRSLGGGTEIDVAREEEGGVGGLKLWQWPGGDSLPVE